MLLRHMLLWVRASSIWGSLLSVLLALLACIAHTGESFVTTGVGGGSLLRKGGLGLGRGGWGARRLVASFRLHALPSSSKARGGGLVMESNSRAPVVTDESFEKEVLDMDSPVLVFFRAPWCGPCRMVAPVVDEVIDELGSKLKVFELCTDENPKTVAEFGIRNIPTIMLFHERKSILTVVGAVPKSGLVSSIKKHMDI